MEQIKYTLIKSDQQYYNIVLRKEFGSYWAITFTASSPYGKSFAELDRALEYFNKQVEETLKFANRTQTNVTSKQIL